MRQFLVTAFACLIAITLTGIAAADQPVPRTRYLLLDNRIIASADNAKLSVGEVRKHEHNPLFGEDKPWEKRFDNLYANVIYDQEDKLYKCWYNPFIVDLSARGMTLQQRGETRYRPPRGREMAICYAVSKDGLKWEKPELGLVEFEGSKQNNIVWRGPHGAGVMNDLRETDPARRYKAFFQGVKVAFSADGIHWGKAMHCPEIKVAGDTHNNALWAPTLGKYVGITRTWGSPFGRQVARTETGDFLKWTKAEVVLEGLEKNLQTYAMPVFYHVGVYLGLAAIHDQKADRVWTELAWSPDTVHWHRVCPGTPLIANSEKEMAYDWGCVYAGAYPVFLENEIRIYYGGSDGLHTGWRNGFLCLATLRPDGFAGYEPIELDKPARIATTAVACTGDALRLSADIAGSGSIKVTVLDVQGKELAEAEPIAKTVTDAAVRWKEGFSLQKLKGREIRLRFDLRGAKLYSFSFVPHAGEPPALPVSPRAKTSRTPPLAASVENAASKGAMASFQGLFADADFDEIVFTTRQPGRDGHWYANFGYATYRPSHPGKFQLYSDGGKMLALNIKTRKVRTILAEPDGGVRDPQVSYDGKKILFSYRKAGQPYYHLYEINTDGAGLRQLTSGPFDDIEPTYLPEGDIIFCSSRVKCNVPCWFTPVAVLHRCSADGRNIRRLSANIEHENTPWPLPDGRILYLRWEYVDRSQVLFHHLWTMNPDGTGQAVFFGNMHGGGAYLDAKPIPNSENMRGPRVVMIHSPDHGCSEHLGYIEIVDPSDGPDSRANVKRITPKPEWRDPYPLGLTTEASGRQWFLAAGPGPNKMSCVSESGEVVALYELPPSETDANMWLQEPRPIRARPRERAVPTRVDLGEGKGRVMLQDVYRGRNMQGIRRGDIKKLLVMEILPMPVKPMREWQQMVSFDGPRGGTFQLERVLGTVPVEEDGSAHFELPALRALFFVALDENDMSVKRMQSFATVQPGETVACVGCHEDRRATPPVTRLLAAAKRGPSRITPIAGIPEVFDYPRDIQPIFDKHCVNCHGYEKTARGGPYAGGVLLAGDRGIFYNQSYGTLRGFHQVADGSNGTGNRPPRSIGASASPLMKTLSGDHHDVQLRPEEKKQIHYWIESAGTFAGTYAALGKGFVMPRQPVVPGNVHKNRCSSCHSQNFPVNKDAPRSHWLYNLDTPAKSVILLAPLAKEAGGWGLCREKTAAKKGPAPPIFDGTQDADYQTILGNVTKLHQELQSNQRYDMPGYVPHSAYLGEMKRFGVIPQGYAWKGPPEEMWRIDEAYWRSLWYQPARGKR